MTMRQVHGLLEVIGVANTIDFYYQLLSYGTFHNAKLPSLEEFLELSSKGDEGFENKFDDDTDKFLEEQAFKRLIERQKEHGR